MPAPYWVSLSRTSCCCARARRSRSPARRITASSCGPRISRRRSRPKTKWLILNSPSNPTGAAYTAAELRALADVLLRHPHVWVLADDMYEHLVYDDFNFTTIAQVEPKLYPRTLTLNGVSKAYCMTGWRIGYAGGPIELIKAMAALQSQSTTNPSSISQAAAVEALNGPQDFIPRNNAVFKDAARSRGRHAQSRRRACIARRRKARSTSIRPAPARSASKTPRGQDDRDRLRISAPICSMPRASRWCRARPSASRRISASPTRPRTRADAKPAPASSAPARRWRKRGRAPRAPTKRRHCERSEAIQLLRQTGLLRRYASRNDG